VRLNVDIIVTASPTDTRAAKDATVTIPIVMAQDTDPVGNGFVASLARPGGNITGLKEVVPRLSRVAVFGTSTRPGTAQQLRETELAAGAFGVKLQYLDVLDPKDIETAFRAASKGRAQAVLSLGGPRSILTERGLQNSRQRIGSQRYTGRQNLRKTGGLCPTA
jgi:putative ABC transport system substrate-binding protein